MATITKSAKLLIAEKWVQDIEDRLHIDLPNLFVDGSWGDAENRMVRRAILKAIDEATAEQRERIEEFYTGLVVKESMAVGETKFCCREAIEEIKKLNLAPEQPASPTQPRAESRTEKLEALLQKIGDKIDGSSTYETNMSHGEHMSLASEYDELLTEIRDLVENRDGGEG